MELWNAETWSATSLRVNIHKCSDRHVTSATDRSATVLYCPCMALFHERYRIESARLRGWDYASPGWYFVTICTYRGQCLLGDVIGGKMVLSPIGAIAESDLKNLPNHYNNVRLDASVVMPNHLHAILIIEGPHRFSLGVSPELEPVPPTEFPHNSPTSGSLAAIIRSYKAGVTRTCHLAGLEIAWQGRFYDHILRKNASVNAVRDYIANNPRNWIKDKEGPFDAHALETLLATGEEYRDNA